jgi:hypothetical protein
MILAHYWSCAAMASSWCREAHNTEKDDQLLIQFSVTTETAITASTF